MDITSKIDIALLGESKILEAKVSRGMKEFMNFCADYGLPKAKMSQILRKSKGDNQWAAEEMMEMIRDDVDPGDMDEADELYATAAYT